MPIRSKAKPMQCANLSFPFARNFIGILSENQYPCVSYAKRLCQPDQPAEPCSIYLLEKLSWSSPPVESVRAGAGFFPEPNRKMDNFIHFSEHPTPVSLLVSMVSPFRILPDKVFHHSVQKVIAVELAHKVSGVVVGSYICRILRKDIADYLVFRVVSLFL